MNLISRLLIAMFDLFIPKKKSWISIPCISDKEWQGNCDFLYNYIVSNKLDYKVKILCSNSSELLTNASSKENAIRLYSVEGILFLLKSKTIIYHHGPLAGRIPIFRFRHFNLHINHGIHYKKVELSLNKNSIEYKKSTFIKTKWFCKYHAVSSHVDSLSCCTDYHVSLSDVFITGIPRNDAFYFSGNENELPMIIQDDLKKITSISKEKKIIVYAPTWRNEGGAYIFSDLELMSLSKFLEEKNAVLFYAGHPYLKERIVPVDKNIYDYNNMCRDIQSVLIFADCLITDYSSVWIDYLLRNKPVISFQFDRGLYDDERGFLFDENKIFPGEIVQSFDSLLKVLNSALDAKINTHENYSHALKTFHFYSDGKNSERVLEVINRKALHG